MIPTDRADAFNIPTGLPRTVRLENWNIQAQGLCDEQLFANKLVDEETPPKKKFEIRNKNIPIKLIKVNLGDTCRFSQPGEVGALEAVEKTRGTRNCRVICALVRGRTRGGEVANGG